MRIVTIMRGAWLLACLSCAACGRSTGPTAPSATASSSVPQPADVPAGTLRLRVSPIDVGEIRFITPLGNLNPPAHTIPTDHIYFYFANPSTEQSGARRMEFRAPGDG